jgi:hypothetical protein
MIVELSERRRVMIKECEFAQRIGRTVKLRLQEPDGSYKNHYHHYRSENKAKLMLVIYGQAIRQRGGVVFL